MRASRVETARGDGRIFARRSEPAERRQAAIIGNDASQPSTAPGRAAERHKDAINSQCNACRQSQLPDWMRLRRSATLAVSMQHRFAAALTSSTLALALSATPTLAEVTQPHTGMKLARQGGRALLVVDLCAPGVGIRATKYGERKKLAQTWGTEVGAQAAVNADFFDFPEATRVIGRARGGGEDWPADKQNSENRQYWQFGPREASLVVDNTIPPPAPSAVTEIVGGHNLIVNGGVSAVYEKPLLNNAYRRTAFGLAQDRRTLFLFTSNDLLTAQGVVDSMFALAAEAAAPPIWWATNEDGGGSTQMWVAGVGQVVSATRLVANHLGVYASGQGPPTSCVPKYAGSFVGQSFPPASEAIELEVGERLEGWFDLENTGTSTWSTATTKLAPIPRDVASPLADPSWPAPHRAAHVAADTPPGAVGRFVVTLHGNEPGEVVQTFGLVEESVTWFADATLGGGPPDDFLAVRVRVTEPPATSSTGGSSPAASAGGGETNADGDAGDGPGADDDDDDSDAASGAGGAGGDASSGSGDLDGGCGCDAPGRRGRAGGAGALAILGALLACVHGNRTRRSVQGNRTRRGGRA